MALRLKIIVININLQDKAFGVPALAGILKVVIRKLKKNAATECLGYSPPRRIATSPC